MRWNIILAVLAAFSQLGNAFLGWKIVGKSLTPKEQRNYDALFIIIGLVGAALVGVIAYRGGRQERAHFAMELQNTYQLVRSDNGSVVAYSWFVVNQPLSFAVYKTNVGSGSAYNVDTKTRSFLEADTSLSSQKQSINEFSSWIKSNQTRSKDTMAKGDRNFSSASGNILTPEDFNNLTSDRRTVYVLARVLFEDDFGSHTVEYCHFLEPQTKMPPGYPGQVGIVEIWGDCEEYNGEN